ncbi:lysophospholipid acyltransferase family protein, partial [Desulfobacterales bacterium HSG17]|nr:lysophospholipid acyltransferase family protein [Desulfobacterales bacterium HSG17]
IFNSSDPNEVQEVDHRFLKQVLPLIKLLKFYFRGEVEGVETVPDGKALIVGNHNAGTTFLEPYIMGLEWYKMRPDDLPYFLTHDLLVSLPIIKNLLVKTMAIRAASETSLQALKQNKKIAVYPGGNYEAFRPYSERHIVDFGGHKGFVKIALKAGAPIIPVANKGGHNTFFILKSGRNFAKMIKLNKILRSDSFPIFIGLPWGIGVGPIPHFPLPAKLKIKIGPPVHLDRYGPDDAENPAVVSELYDLVVDRVQALYDSIA